MWFPRLASDQALRTCPVDAPFALTLRQSNTEWVHCLNARAERQGLHRGMRMADARVFCPDLVSRPARPDLDARFLAALRRWATRYCPWVACEGEDGLVLDVTGSTHLWGGEAAMLSEMRMRATRAGLSLRLGLAVQGFIQVQLGTHGPEQSSSFARLIRGRPEVTSAWTMTGEADYLLRVYCVDLPSLNRLIHEVLLAHPAVARVQSQIVMDQLKRDAPLPT